MEWIVAQQPPLGSNSVADNQSIPELVIILIILLMIATTVALVTQRLRIPYVTGLVLAGLPITEVLSRRIRLDPALVLNLFLPILIFEAAINTDISRLHSTLKVTNEYWQSQVLLSSHDVPAFTPLPLNHQFLES